MTGRVRDDVGMDAAESDYDFWVAAEGGERIRRRTHPGTVDVMLRLLDLGPGMRVLEVGTGSGYSAALLARIVGPAGRVVSLDLDDAPVQRAGRLHGGVGNGNVEVHTGDGFAGWPQGGPFDRVVAWITPQVLPKAWVRQTVSGGVIVTRVGIAEIALADALLRCRVADGRPHEPRLYPARCGERTAAHGMRDAVPTRYVNAHQSDPHAVVWISARALHDQRPAVAAALAEQLASAEPEPGFLDPGEHSAFTGYVLATSLLPASAGTAHGWGIGTATSRSIAVVLADGRLLAAGAQQARTDLGALFAQWHSQRTPRPSGYDHIAPVVSPSNHGWIIRPRILAQRL